MPRDDDYELVHNSATTNTTPGSKVPVAVNMAPICSNMTNKQFVDVVLRARDAAVTLIKDRIAAVARWDRNEQDRAKTYFGRADEEIRRIMVVGLPRLLRAMQELVPDKIVRWDDERNRNLSCSVIPDSGNNHAAVCKPDSEKRVIAIYSKFCTDSDGELYHASKVKVLIHECTHYIDTFDSEDIRYGDTELGMKLFAMSNPDEAIRNADSITGYIATFDRIVIQ
ncbi:M35 family metallo-endopeptidase [Burkholderia ubonensis]|uniref:M35 family metallo-endopeptidase n=1 Tax=Burkholderia ubonensis TaxID=101571 RepID=UPI0009B30D72|nr:M35 family metallo-endopeptidase [Burkholderia ubonensis]